MNPTPHLGISSLSKPALERVISRQQSEFNRAVRALRQAEEAIGRRTDSFSRARASNASVHEIGKLMDALAACTHARALRVIARQRALRALHMAIAERQRRHATKEELAKTSCEGRSPYRDKA
jgi:hypothetical protein